MNVYKEMYLKLFNTVTTIIKELQIAQVEAERAYIHAEDDELENDVGESGSEDANANQSGYESGNEQPNIG